MDVERLLALVVVSWLAMRLVEELVTPIFERQGWDRFYIKYGSMVVGAAMGYFTGINAFPVFEVSAAVGRGLTCLVVGLGPSFIWDVIDKEKDSEETDCGA